MELKTAYGTLRVWVCPGNPNTSQAVRFINIYVYDPLSLERVSLALTSHPHYGMHIYDVSDVPMRFRHALAFGVAWTMLVDGIKEIAMNGWYLRIPSTLEVFELAKEKHRRIKDIALAIPTCAKRYRAAHRIADHWKTTYKNPYCAMGRKQLLREFDGLVAGV